LPESQSRSISKSRIFPEEDYAFPVIPIERRTMMQKTLQVIMGTAVLGVCLFLAPAAEAKHVASKTSGVPDKACVAKHDADIKNCGKNKKCVAKHKKLKKNCPKIYKPAEAPHMMPGQPMPGQPMPMPGQPMARPMPAPGQMPMRPMMPSNMVPRPMPMMRPDAGVLERTAPQPSGKATGVKSVPDNTYTPPWMNF
jgi:hypothetical protein